MAAQTGSYIDPALTVQGPFNVGASFPAEAPVNRHQKVPFVVTVYDGPTKQTLPPEGTAVYATLNAAAVAITPHSNKQLPSVNAYTNGGNTVEAAYLNKAP